MDMIPGETETMTEAQREAIQKAWDLLSEHYDHVLVILDWRTEQDDDAHVAYWHGGALCALGMAEFAREGIQRSGRKASEPE